MPRKNEIAMPESLENMEWPLHGLNLATEFASQPSGTTPVGVNVRTYEPLALRARGGSRSGLSQYIEEQVLDMVSTIQHVGVIVDPTTEALIDDWPGSDFVLDPSTNNRSIRNPAPARHVRRGGNGGQPNRNKKTPKLKPSITSVVLNSGSPTGGETVTINGANLFNTVSGASSTVKFGKKPATVLSQSTTVITVTSPGGMVNTTVDVVVKVAAGAPNNPYGGKTPITPADQYTFNPASRVQSNGQTTASGGAQQSLAFSSNVTMGNLLIFVFGSIDGNQTGASIPVAVTDSQGNSYTQAGTYASILRNGNEQIRVSIWYAVAGSTGANTVLYTPTGSGDILGGAAIIEYTGLKFNLLDGVSSNTGAAPIGALQMTTGSVTVSGTNEVLLGCFQSAFASMTPDFPFSTIATGLFVVADLIPISSSAPVTASGAGGNATDKYAAIGASFN